LTTTRIYNIIKLIKKAVKRSDYGLFKIR
jgi:hypothetical protein